MRKVILQEFVSLDGRAAGPNDSVDFIPASMKGDRTFGQGQMALLDTIDTILLGRVTYQMFAGYFPLVTEGDDDKAFADKLNAIPKIVFSNTLTQAPWGKWDDATIVRRSPTQEVTALKQLSGKDLVVWGSISVAQSLIDAELIDEYRLVVCPVVLGSGRPLFRDKANALDMTLVETKAHDNGSVLLKYTKGAATAAPAAAPVLETASVR
jgi:dihydrofolate reductase